MNVLKKICLKLNIIYDHVKLKYTQLFPKKLIQIESDKTLKIE